jgi:hypothetical protein
VDGQIKFAPFGGADPAEHALQVRLPISVFFVKSDVKVEQAQ